MGELPCPLCPYRVLDEPDDEISAKTFRFIELATGGVVREQAPPWALIFAACGIHDLETFREVWVRAGMARHLAEAHDALTRQGQPPRRT